MSYYVTYASAGCLPDSEPDGPFLTPAEAAEHILEQYWHVLLDQPEGLSMPSVETVAADRVLADPREHSLYSWTIAYVPTVECRFCQSQVPEATAHFHDGGWVGDECCWDERLRSGDE